MRAGVSRAVIPEKRMAEIAAPTMAPPSHGLHGAADGNHKAEAGNIQCPRSERHGEIVASGIAGKDASIAIKCEAQMPKPTVVAATARQMSR
jgi:hypothetical protein